MQGEIKATSHEGSVLSCTVSRYFWVGIDETGGLAIGKDRVPFKKRLMRWKDDDDPGTLNAMSISTGNDQIGVWEFTEIEGN